MFKFAREFAANSARERIAIRSDNITKFAPINFGDGRIKFIRVIRNPSFGRRIRIRVFASLIFMIAPFSIFDHYKSK